MINRIVAICLLFSLIGSSFSRFFVYASFEVNQKYIASTLCENRDKPQLHCNGKCYLAKKLKQAEEKERKQEENAQKKGFQDNFLVKAIVQLRTPVYVLKKNTAREGHFDLPQRSFDILHPPRYFHFS